MSQCDTTTQQPSPVPGAAPIISAVVNGDTDTSGSMSINTLPDIKRCGAAEDGDTTLALINPWRQLDRNAFVIAYAMKGTVRCGACLRKVDKGELQVGSTGHCNNSYMRINFKYHNLRVKSALPLIHSSRITKRCSDSDSCVPLQYYL